MNPTRRQARIAGLLYFVAALFGPFSLLYVPGALIVPGDATATADRVRASPSLLRMGIAGELIGTTLFIFAVVALYRLLKPVSEKQASLMAILILLSVPISFVDVLNDIAPLILARGVSFLSPF